MRRLTDEPLHVAPALVGAALASPARRVAAFAADAVLLIVPTLAVAFAAVALALGASDPRALRAIGTLIAAPRTDTASRHAAMCDLVPLLVRTEAKGLPASVTAAVEEGDVARACETLRGYDIGFNLSFVEGEGSQRVEARHVVVPLQHVIPPGVRALALLGVPALYFVVFARSRRGATIGKRLFGIRVARLDGEQMSWLESLERFVGYAHIPGTLFLSLADLWRDPNRRLPHDRVVHTGVFRVRRHEPFPPAGDTAEREPGIPPVGSATSARPS